MSFDKPTRNALANMVGECRRLLTDDIGHQLQAVYGLQPDGTALAVSTLGHLDERGHEIAQALREWQDHLASTEAGTEPARKKSAFERLAHETAFTVLNRLAALRMCEERGHVIECVRRGTESDGFVLYERFSGGELGTRGETYQIFLERMFDELAVDLGSLFDLRAPQSLIFPRERCLEEVLTRLNEPKLAHLWKEDETIGWVYQYFNSKEEREKMREASAAPRNSRELAVRNQFFTPRYVVEFLVDNTLGRIWYEMRKGQTALADDCRYLVRRKRPVFLGPGQEPPRQFSNEDWQEAMDVHEMWTRPNPDSKDLDEIWRYSLTVNGYDYSKEVFGRECGDLANERANEYRTSKKWRGSFEELRCCLFFEQRRYRHFGYAPEDDEAVAIQDLHKSICKQWELETEFILHRGIKDPRDLKILDPACGSGHFLLYCFDLLETIYEEAWAVEQPVPSEATGRKLREDYPDLDSLKRALPGLILRHNLHGIDIDLRACQIAALALWLRAQRSYQRLGLKGAGRLKITKSNIVCAEPMPGEKAFLGEFIAGVEPKVIGQLVQFVFEKMKLAGEAGSLLKIEEEIASAVAEAKKQWLAGPKAEQRILFAESRRPEQKKLGLDTSGITDESFWESAEERIYSALKSYAEHAETGGGYQRRLFADDAARGFAFIDLCRNSYDAVLMNPPFGEWSSATKPLALTCYPRTKYDLYAAFVERGIQLFNENAMLGAITSRTGFFLSSFQKWREEILLEEAPPSVYADLGHGVLDSAMVEVAAYCLSARPSETVFLRALEADEKGVEVLRIIQDPDATNNHRFVVDPRKFTAIPKSPFAYWSSNRLRGLFQRQSKVEMDGRIVRIGLTTHEDFRWLRLSWECTADGGAVPFAKGGKFSKYYADVYLRVLWGADGTLLKQSKRERLRAGELTANNSQCWNEPLYFRPGISWPRRTDGLSMRVMPRCCIFADKGPAVFIERDDEQELLALLAITNSRPFYSLVALQLARTELAQSYEVGLIQQTPYPVLSRDDKKNLADLARQAWLTGRTMDVVDLSSTAFIAPALVVVQGANLEVRASVWNSLLQDCITTLSSIQGEIDGLALSLYGVDEIDVLNPSTLWASPSIMELSGYEDKAQESTSVSHSDKMALVGELSEYAVGCSLGRWNIKFATRETNTPGVSDPFAPLPICPPGMLQNEQGLPLTQDDFHRFHAAGQWHYPLEIPWDGILVDDAGLDGTQPHRDDIVRRVRQVLTVIWKDRAEAIEQEACEILEVKDLREYFRKSALFFADHLKRYSKSRRQAPIYWPLSTASGSYTLWIYYHRLNDQTLYTALNNYVKPKIDEIEKQIRRIESELPGAMGRQAAKLRDTFEGTKAFLEELRELRDELQRVAALPYKPNLNDGVLITASPLWKLFRLPKWRKDLEACWKELAAGEYDWAHLAYSIGPDRVRDVCKRDRSIAITHGLEKLCKVLDRPTRKRPRRQREGPVESVLEEEE